MRYAMCDKEKKHYMFVPWDVNYNESDVSVCKICAAKVGSFVRKEARKETIR